MWLVSAVRLFIWKLIWQITRSSRAGHQIVRALGSKDENIQMMAGMLLVRAGKRAEPVLQEAMQRRENLPTVLTILGDIGDRSVEKDLRGFVIDGDPDVARAASDALRVLSHHP